MADTGEMVDVEAADNVLVNGVLTSGALLSYQISAVPYHADGWRLAVYGSKGTIISALVRSSRVLWPVSDRATMLLQ